MSSKNLIIEGARQNNLRNISLSLPHNRVITVTGVSGSGKSSLAFDTIFAEGQRRFVESLSTYARLFLEKLDRPDVESIRNIRPTIALEQRNPVKGSRSTVGTATELHDYLRLLYAKIGHPHCPECGKPLRSWTTSSVVQELLSYYAGEKAMVIFNSGESPEDLAKKGFHRIREGGKEAGSMREVIVDRLVIRNEPRLSDSVELAWKNGNGSMTVDVVRESQDQSSKNVKLRFFTELRCASCNVHVQRPQPLLFSFNHPLGACPACKGFGNTLEYSEDCIIPEPLLSIDEGAIEPWSKPAYRRWHRQFVRAARKKGIRTDIPFSELSDEVRRLIFRGDDDFYGLERFFSILEEKRYKLHVRVFLSRYRKAVTCTACGGSRLKPEALAYRLGGYHIAQLTEMPISEMEDFFTETPVTVYEKDIAADILRQINLKLRFLQRVGLGYLTLNRQTRTLSGGESQRISLSNQLSSRLTGTLYVLDEPTVGLHPVDVSRISDVLTELAVTGNTIIAVEHDRHMINASDWIVELGPGGGEAGGRLVFSGWKDAFHAAHTLTSECIHNKEYIPLPERRRKGNGKTLRVTGASGNNLKRIDVDIPLGTMTCITGVSGSGKSTLVEKTIARCLERHFKISYETPLSYRSIEGLEHIKGVKMIDQQPIGKSPRSNPVTYIRAFDVIRRLFAGQSLSQRRGYGPGHFSFNTEGGRCVACKGAGSQLLDMFFFDDIYITCDECGGKRYRLEILDIKYNGKNISDVLKLTVDDAAEFFRTSPSVVSRLKLMSSVGLGYLRLGQPATTLSGGEAQRLKICAELGIAGRKEFLYVLDEPSVGLHTDDILKLLKVLNDLVNAGNTVLVVEHNLDFIKSCDWLIDLGPGGGDNGGYIIAQGRPEDIMKRKKSLTGKYLREYIGIPN